MGAFIKPRRTIRFRPPLPQAAQPSAQPQHVEDLVTNEQTQGQPAEDDEETQEPTPPADVDTDADDDETDGGDRAPVDAGTPDAPPADAPPSN